MARLTTAVSGRDPGSDLASTHLGKRLCFCLFVLSCLEVFFGLFILDVLALSCGTQDLFIVSCRIFSCGM